MAGQGSSRYPPGASGGRSGAAWAGGDRPEPDLGLAEQDRLLRRDLGPAAAVDGAALHDPRCHRAESVIYLYRAGQHLLRDGLGLGRDVARDVLFAETVESESRQ